MNRQSAEILAFKGLAFLANDAPALEKFLTLTGTTASELRGRAEEPEFLAALLDFLMTDEPLLTAFCEAEAVDAATFYGARRALPGA